MPDANLSSFDPSTVTAFVRKFKHSDCKLNFPPITPEQTQHIIQSIPSSKATGADELGVRLLKIAAPSIASSLAKLINLCIAKHTFPSQWKQARVVPLHKCGTKSDKNNYRPISVLPILSKVLERHLFNALHNFLSSNSLLYNLQSGFRGHHSTETALITIIDRALNNLDNNCINGFIFADFKKAFDLVDHDLLLEKLRLYDLDDSSLHLMRSYLTSRKQFTTVENVSSPLRELTHGVPQGSVLAPLLFLIFINDLPEAFTPSTTVDIFADDTTLSNSATWNEVGTLKNDLGNSILLLEDWSKQNRPHLNIKKTKSMLIDSVCNKLSKRIGLLRSIKHLLPKQERIILYNSIIKPILMYGSVVWTKTSNENIRRAFRLQKRAARVILNVGLREEQTVTIFNKLNWIPFYDETNINKCCIVYKCLQGMAPAYLVNRLSKVSEISSRSTRYSDINLRCPRYTRETEGGKTFISTASKLWNSLPVHISRSPNLISFKRELFSHQKSHIGLDHFSIS